MLKLPRARRLFGGTVLSALATCTFVTHASAQTVAPLVLGPASLGSAVTYRLSTVNAGTTTSASNAQTIALRWKLSDKVVATDTGPGGRQGTPFVATRAADGTFALDNVSADDPQSKRLASAFAVMNGLTSFVAGAPNGARAWSATLVLQPALTVPVSVTRSSASDGTTLTASGSVARNITLPATADSGREGIGTNAAPKTQGVTTKVTASAHFGLDGVLTSATIVETNSEDGESGLSTRSWEIDRTL
jgi:hypothetical protein